MIWKQNTELIKYNMAVNTRVTELRKQLKESIELSVFLSREILDTDTLGNSDLSVEYKDMLMSFQHSMERKKFAI